MTEHRLAVGRDAVMVADGADQFLCRAELLTRRTRQLEIADDANPDGRIVPIVSVSADRVERASALDRAVLSDDVVIADARPTVLSVPTMDCGGVDIFIGIADVMNYDGVGTVSTLKIFGELELDRADSNVADVACLFADNVFIVGQDFINGFDRNDGADGKFHGTSQKLASCHGRRKYICNAHIKTFDAQIKIPAFEGLMKKNLSAQKIFYMIQSGGGGTMFEIILLTAALVSIIVLYKFLPNRKVFVYFCVSMLLMFCAGAFFGLQAKSDTSMDEAQRDERLRQEKFFIDWYSGYQKDIEQLDRNWQLYHSIVDNYKTNKADLANTFERLQELERDVLDEQIRIHTMEPPAQLDSECSKLLSQVIRKTQLYVDAQMQTISLTKDAANPELITFEDHNELSRRFQDIMIRESPVGLFTASEISALLDYFAVTN